MKSSNIFFFRGDDRDYSIEEMRNRVPAQKIKPEVPEVMEILEELNEVPSETSNLNKKSHLDLIKEEFSRSRYETYVSELFKKYGKRGDKFNIQLFEFKQADLLYSKLVEEAEDFEGSDISERFSEIRDLPLVLKQVQADHDNSIVDFSFQTIESEEWINATEDLPIVVYYEGEEIERYTGQEYEIKAPASYRIEARAYVDYGLIAVSNSSSVSDGDQTDIVEFIGQIGRTSEEEDNG